MPMIRSFRRESVSRARRVRRKSYSSYIENKTAALELALDRIAYFNSTYNFTFKKISIKNQTSRWGSCSRRGNINFNYRIALIAPELADYIIVHELCHLGEFNHSKRFWDLVEKTVPNWRELRAKLKEEGKKLF